MVDNPTMTLPMAAALCRESALHSNDAADELDAAANLTDGERVQTLLSAYRELEFAKRRREMAQRTIVAAIREDGATWEQVGSLLGTTRQAAWKRFGGSHGLG